MVYIELQSQTYLAVGAMSAVGGVGGVEDHYYLTTLTPVRKLIFYLTTNYVTTCHFRQSKLSSFFVFSR